MPCPSERREPGLSTQAIMMDRKQVFNLNIPMRRGDIDSMGHVNNTMYFRFMEETRVGWYEHIGVNDNGPAVQAGCGPIVVNASCSFRKAFKYPGDVVATLFVSDPGRSSLMTWYEFRASYDLETVFAEGSAKAVWIDIQKEKSVPLPMVVRALFEG